MKLNVIGPSRGSTLAVREDGLTVFLDGDEILDRIRKSGTREEVILAVAMRRAQQIALNYARSYAPDLYEQLEASFELSCIGSPVPSMPPALCGGGME